MLPVIRRSAALDRLLAIFLQYGSWAACALVCAGVIVEALANAGIPDVTTRTFSEGALKAGVALFILLPVLRVILMLIAFVRQRNYKYTAVAASVLVIVVTSCVLGMRLASFGE
jgi:uncharacterized membrane protein